MIREYVTRLNYGYVGRSVKKYSMGGSGSGEGSF